MFCTDALPEPIGSYPAPGNWVSLNRQELVWETGPLLHQPNLCKSMFLEKEEMLAGMHVRHAKHAS